MTDLFLAWVLEVGKAFLFLLAAVPSGAGVSLGLVVLGFEALLPKTLLIARSIGAPPFVLFSTLRLLGAGLPLTGGVAGEIPKPTGPADSAAGAFRDLLLPWAFLDDSCSLLSASASAA